MTERFHLAEPLPEGLLVLEASAGTGKTWSLEGIAVRSIAERGLRASQLCIVSFTRLATADLRARVRRRLAGAAAFLDSDDTSSSDELHQVLIDGIDASERARRARAVRNALAEFDSASITTIHGFCTRVLASGGADASLPISEDDDDVIELAQVEDRPDAATYGQPRGGSKAEQPGVIIGAGDSEIAGADLRQRLVHGLTPPATLPATTLPARCHRK